MIIEKLEAIAVRLTNLLAEGRVIAILDELIAALTTYISSPNEPSLNAITTALNSLKEAVTTDEWNYLPRTWLPYLDEIGFTQYLGENLTLRLKGLLNFADISSAQAKDEITRIRKDIANYDEAFKSIIKAASTLGIEGDNLEPGQAELGVLLPRGLFDNELAKFAVQTAELDKLVRVFEELATGSRESPKIHQISTSDPSLFLWITPPAVLMLLKALNMMLTAYEKVLSIRKLRAEIAATLSPDLGKKIEEEAQAQVAATIAKLIPAIIAESKVADPARNHELANELSIRLPMLATWIDRGVRIEATIQPLPKKKKDEAADTAEIASLRSMSKQIADLSQKIRRYELVGEPILNLAPPANDVAGPT